MTEERIQSIYLQYLPAIYQEDEFLGRFLMIFEDVLSPVERILENIHFYFDPMMAPEGFLPWLASWIDLVLDENWPIDNEKRREFIKRQRELIKAGVELYRWRGTKRGLREYLRIYTGVESEIIEHFDENDGGPYRFTVIIRVPDPKSLDERLVRRVINAEKPAHTTYELRVSDLKAETVMKVEGKIKDGKKQEAINLILKEIKASKMPNLEKCDGKTMTYDSTIAAEGQTTCTYDPATNKASKIVVKIGDDAFSSVAQLYSSMMHEYQHVNQFLSNPKMTANLAMSDFAAYTWEIHHAYETGVIIEPDKMKELGKRLKSQGWDQMTNAEKKANKKTYDESIEIIREAIGDKSWKP
jgi:phage tail-like protein